MNGSNLAELATVGHCGADILEFFSIDNLGSRDEPVKLRNFDKPIGILPNIIL